MIFFLLRFALQPLYQFCCGGEESDAYFGMRLTSVILHDIVFYRRLAQMCQVDEGYAAEGEEERGEELCLFEFAVGRFLI